MENSRIRFSKISFVCILVSIFMVTNGFCQTLTVTEGVSAEKKETRIVFNAVNNKPAEIYQIISFSNTIGSTIGVAGGNVVSGTINKFGTNVGFVCTTPSELMLDKGQIKLQVGAQQMGSAMFTINATGGTQYWNIRPMNIGLWVGGYVSIIVGFTAAVLGYTFVACDLDSDSMLPLGVIGTVVGIAGIPMMCFGNAKATLIKIE